MRGNFFFLQILGIFLTESERKFAINLKQVYLLITFLLKYMNWHTVVMLFLHDEEYNVVELIQMQNYQQTLFKFVLNYFQIYAKKMPNISRKRKNFPQFFCTYIIENFFKCTYWISQKNNSLCLVENSSRKICKSFTKASILHFL